MTAGRNHKCNPTSIEIDPTRIYLWFCSAVIDWTGLTRQVSKKNLTDCCESEEQKCGHTGTPVDEQLLENIGAKKAKKQTKTEF